MQIGDPVRTIVVEPLELPVNQPTGEPKPVAVPQRDGLDCIISIRREHYIRRQQERTLKQGDRGALLRRGIAVVEQADEQDTVLVSENKLELRIARKDIVFNQNNLRWECGTNFVGSGVRAKT